MITLNGEGLQIDNMNSQDAQIAGMAFKCRADATLGFEWVDEGAKRVTGYTHTELVETGKIALPDLVQPAGRENVRKMIQDGINRLGTFAVPFGILTKERVPAEGILIGKGIFAGPLTLTGIEGYLLRMQAPAGTISANAEKQLPGDLWHQLLDHTGDIITYIASDGTIRYITPSVLRILGYRPEEIVMTRFSALLAPGEAGRFEEVRERVHLMGSGGSSTRFQAITAGGAPVLVLIRMFGSVDAGGVILAITPVQEEKPLSSSAEELFQAACRASPVPLLITGRKDRRITHTNDAFLRLTGHGSEDEVIGLTLTGAGLQATTDELDSIESVLDVNGGYEGEITTIRTSLSEVSILLSARSFYGGQKVIIWSLVPLPSKIESRAGDGETDQEGAKERTRRYKAGLQLLEGVMSTKSLHADIPSGMVIREMRTFLYAVSGFYTKPSGSDQTMICAYLHAIGDHITEKYEDLLGPVTITVRCDGDWIMASDRGIPVGIITTELVINSITHAFDPDENGRIEVIFSREEDWYILEVRDTGKGLPEEITRGQPTSAGLSLVEDLTMQISGTANFSNNAGARVRIIFPDQ